jgi:uncharacterized protein GlcG (DUF336 family)
VSKTVNRPSISLELAHEIVTACERKASEMEKLMVIAVVDESGVLKAFSRMDGAALLSVGVAQGKAFSAAAQGIPTDAWHDFIKDDPPLLVGAGLADDRLVMIGGGYPITIDDQVIGGVGVSGGYYTEDMEVAQAGLAVV